MASTAIKHTSAVLKLPRRVKNIGSFAQSILTAMTGNASFPNPQPSLATVEADLAAFVSAEAAVLSRTKGAAQERNVKLVTLRTDLDHLMAYVQQVADATPSSAASIIESAGLAVRKVTLHTKGEISVVQGTVSGSAKLVAKSVGSRAAYEWQYSTDQKTWLNAPSTLQSKTEIDGLSPGTAYFFRSRGITKAGPGDYTQVVSLLMT
jgi:hypothetical protein